MVELILSSSFVHHVDGGLVRFNTCEVDSGVYFVDFNQKFSDRTPEPATPKKNVSSAQRRPRQVPTDQISLVLYEHGPMNTLHRE